MKSEVKSEENVHVNSDEAQLQSDDGGWASAGGHENLSRTLRMQPTSTRILVHICVLPLEIRISRPNQQFHIAIMPLLARGGREAQKHTRRGGGLGRTPSPWKGGLLL